MVSRSLPRNRDNTGDSNFLIAGTSQGMLSGLISHAKAMVGSIPTPASTSFLAAGNHTPPSPETENFSSITSVSVAHTVWGGGGTVRLRGSGPFYRG